jgi:hypothetical protein
LPQEGQEIPSFPPFIFGMPGQMSDRDEIQSQDGGPTQFDRDEAFCARMLWAIQAGLENAPIGVVTTPGTKNPKHVATEPRPPVSSQSNMEHA